MGSYVQPRGRKCGNAHEVEPGFDPVTRTGLDDPSPCGRLKHVLTSFSLANFKSYDSAELPLAPLTLLLGANAAGKSNLIEAMQLLASLAS